MERNDFKSVFEGKFTEFLQSGQSRAEAAANALLVAKEILSKGSHNMTVTPPLAPMIIAVPSLPPPVSLHSITATFQKCQNEGVFDLFLQLVQNVFSNPELLSRSFCAFDNSHSLESRKSDAMMIDTSEVMGEAAVDRPNPNGSDLDLDIESVKQSYELILSNVAASTLLMECLDKLFESSSKSVPSDAPGFSTSSSMSNLKQYLIVLECPLLLDPDHSDVVHKTLVAIDKLSIENKRGISSWIQHHSGEQRYRWYITLIHQYMTLQVLQENIEEARVAIKVLGILYDLRPHFSSVDIKVFYSDALSEHYLESPAGQNEIRYWYTDVARRERQQRTTATTATAITRTYTDSVDKSFISYPFVLTPARKAWVLEIDAAIQMRRGMNQEIQLAMLTGQQYVVPYFVLRVSRERIVQDTLSQVMLFEDTEFKKPLKIIFDDEEGVDAGGVRKEFYQVSSTEILFFWYLICMHLLFVE